MTGQPQQQYIITEEQITAQETLLRHKLPDLRSHPYQSDRDKVLDELKKKILSNTTDPEHASRNGRYLKQCVVMVTDIERIFEELRTQQEQP